MSRIAFKPYGVITASLLPFREDFEIDESTFRKHLRDMADVRGITGITVNGHASEVSSCTLEEQERVIEIAVDEIGDKVPVVSGIYADGSINAAKMAKRAESIGVSALLIFPPVSFADGVKQKGDMALSHYGRIADAVALPFIAFQYPIASGYGLPLELLLKLAETIPNVKAIKDFCSDPAYHELTIRTLQSVPKPLAVLSTHTAWLLSSLAHGCAGVLSGSASTIPDVLVAMWDAVQAQDLPRARAIADRLHHWTRAVYITPWCDTFSRMKEVQVQLKRWPRSVVRPPLTPLAPEERAHLARAIEAVGLKPEGAVRREDTRIRDVLAEGVST